MLSKHQKDKVKSGLLGVEEDGALGFRGFLGVLVFLPVGGGASAGVGRSRGTTGLSIKGATRASFLTMDEGATVAASAMPFPLMVPAESGMSLPSSGSPSISKETQDVNRLVIMCGNSARKATKI